MAIVNGFDTKELRYILFGDRGYEIYKENDFYYLSNGYVLVKWFISLMTVKIAISR